MTAALALPRLRHLALVAGDLEAASVALRAALGLGIPYTRDPLASQWGVRNAVFALDDQFLEVISPLAHDNPAARGAAAAWRCSRCRISVLVAPVPGRRTSGSFVITTCRTRPARNWIAAT